MKIECEATYENGVLKLDAPVPLREGERVHVTVLQKMSRARQSAGLMGWTGSAEDAEYFAESPELDINERP